MSKDWKGKKLYHYTGYSALEGIIGNKELWLCNVKAMNDKAEMFHYMDTIRTSICNGLSKDQFRKTNTLFDEQIARLKDQPVYAMSFSLLQDDAAQWERYAVKGKGVCIQFNTEILEKICDKHALIKKVYYTLRVAQKNEHLELIRKYITDGYVDELAWGNINAIFSNCWACSSIYKHKSFKSEAEVRIVSLPFALKTFLDGPYYKMEPWGIREYYKIKISEKIENLISEIIIGPRANVTVDTLQRYLQHLSNDYTKIKVKESECPLR